MLKRRAGFAISRSSCFCHSSGPAKCSSGVPGWPHGKQARTGQRIVKEGSHPRGQGYGGQPVSPKMKEQPFKRLSNDDLIQELRRVHSLVGKSVLTVSDFNANSITSAEAIRRRFGGWPDGLRIAGIAQSELANKGWPDSKYFENLATVWTKLGRAPHVREMAAPPSTTPAKAYEYRWGTWRKALAAFVDWANSDEQSASNALPRLQSR
jgi:Homing endonuclease associated repeat